MQVITGPFLFTPIQNFGGGSARSSGRSKAGGRTATWVQVVLLISGRIFSSPPECTNLLQKEKKSINREVTKNFAFYSAIFVLKMQVKYIQNTFKDSGIHTNLYLYGYVTIEYSQKIAIVTYIPFYRIKKYAKKKNFHLPKNIKMFPSTMF